MAGRLPSVPILNPSNAVFAIEQISSHLNAMRGALEERTSAIQALGFNPSVPLWVGRNLPSALLPLRVPSGVQAFGLYDAIALVWNFDSDPALDGWEILKDGTVIDFVKTFCYVDQPIGDLATHAYEVRAVRIGDAARTTATPALPTPVAAETDEATIRNNYDAAVLALQTAAMGRTAATGVYASTPDAEVIIDDSTGVDPVTICSVVVPTPGTAVPILVAASARSVEIRNLPGTGGPVNATANFYITRDSLVADNVYDSTWGPIPLDAAGGPLDRTQVPFYAEAVEIRGPSTETYRFKALVFADSGTGVQLTFRYPSITALVFKR